MKTKLIKCILQLRVVSKVVLSISIIALVLLNSCESDSLISNNNQEYLHLSKDLDLSNLSEQDLSKLGEAISRINLSSKDGLYQIKQTSAKQLNISDDLFALLNSFVENTNSTIKAHSQNGTIFPRLKFQDIEFIPINSRTTDCVAWALSGLKGVSYEDANSWITSRYGYGGVPASQIGNVFYHFYPNGSDFNLTGLPSGGLNNALFYYSTSDSTGHAANALLYDAKSGIIFYKDLQNDKGGFIEASKVSRLYGL